MTVVLSLAVTFGIAVSFVLKPAPIKEKVNTKSNGANKYPRIKGALDDPRERKRQN